MKELDKCYKPDNHPPIPQRQSMPIQEAMNEAIEKFTEGAWQRVQLLHREKLLLQALDRLQKDM